LLLLMLKNGPPLAEAPVRLFPGSHSARFDGRREVSFGPNQLCRWIVSQEDVG